jgi:DNA-binding SARP family transcriptional activator
MQTVKITTFGEYSITLGDKTIAEKDKRSKKMWTLLKYLTAFKEKGTTQAELINLLWDGTSAGNPAGALKTQLHRIRKVLAEALELENGVELVVSSGSTYAFNSAFEYIIDAVEFEKHYKNSERDEISEKERISFVKKAFELYGDEYMKTSRGAKWAVPIRVYYRSMYIRVVHRLIDALFTHKKYNELINVCRKALLIENTDQKIHVLLIKALAASGEHDSAKRHYEYITDTLYNELGINPQPELRELFTEIVERGINADTPENDLEAIKQKLKEEKKETAYGAFYCEVDVFKSIYRLKMRDAERSGQKVQICLITVTEPPGQTRSSRSNAIEMRRLHECIKNSLRKSDIYSRYSVSQFVLMLPSEKDETSKVVTNRIIERYKAAHSGFTLEINFKHVMA